MNTTCVFIGGRQIGVNCLKELVARDIFPAFIAPETKWMPALTDVIADANSALADKTKVTVGISTTGLESNWLADEIRKIQPEIIFHVGGVRLIPPEILRIPRLGVLNIHPSLLPRYRGRYSNVWAIFNGETETGATLHWMDAGIDSGPIIAQDRWPIWYWDTGQSLWNTFTDRGTKLFARFLDDWLAGKAIESTPQDESQATYYPKGFPNGGEIDWSWDGAKILRFIRAMQFEGYPPVTFKIGEREMEIRAR